MNKDVIKLFKASEGFIVSRYHLDLHIQTKKIQKSQITYKLFTDKNITQFSDLPIPQHETPLAVNWRYKRQDVAM